MRVEVIVQDDRFHITNTRRIRQLSDAMYQRPQQQRRGFRAIIIPPLVALQGQAENPPVAGSRSRCNRVSARGDSGGKPEAIFAA